MMTLVSPTDKTGNFKVHRANVDSDSDVCISDPHQFQTPRHQFKLHPPSLLCNSFSKKCFFNLTKQQKIKMFL